MPDSNLTYRKTDAGAAEITARRLELTPAERRLLILIDGVRTVGDLRPFVRQGDLNEAIHRLISLGLVSSSSLEGAPSEEAMAHDRRVLLHLKSELNGMFASVLGQRGTVFDARVQDAVSLQDLRSVMRQILDETQRRTDPETSRQMNEWIRLAMERADGGSPSL